MLNRAKLVALACISAGCIAGCASLPSRQAQTAANASAAAEVSRAASAAGQSRQSGADQTEWDRTLVAAKKEGKVVVSGPPGDVFRQALTSFQQSYPEIQVEFTGIRSSDWGPRLVTERQSGQFLWDVFVGGTGTSFTQLLPAKALDPIKPALVLPEVVDDSKWFNGLDWGFIDEAHQHILSFNAYVDWSIYLNRDLIPEGQFTKLEDLLDARYKGKVSINEPRETGAGSFHSAIIINAIGADKFRKFLAEQDVAVNKDLRQQVEALVRGSRPIAIGVQTAFLDDFKRQGLGANVRPLEVAGGAGLTPGNGGCACLINRAPHPNAAKVYLNWLLSKDGQTIWSKATATNSRRLDVPPANPAMVPKPGTEYLFIEREQNQHMRGEAIELAKQVLQ